MASETTSPADVELVQIVRGGAVDCVHRGRIAIVDRHGKLLYQAGDVQADGFLRSIGKPFQAAAMIEMDAARYFGFTPPEIALAAGSHSGTRQHTDIVQGMMYKVGVTADELQCGAIPPLDRAAYEELIASGGKPNTMTNNCSGKHTTMLAACRANGWDMHTYTRPEHPVQRGILDYLARTCDYEAEKIHLAPDGCGVPTFGLPLYNIALGFMRLAVATAKQDGALGYVGQVMQQHPLVFSGERRIDAALVQVTETRLVVKDGAEAIVGVAIPERGIGIAMKISDGAQRAILPTLRHLLLERGYISGSEAQKLDAMFPPAVFTNAGQHAGDIRVTL